MPVQVRHESLNDLTRLGMLSTTYMPTSVIDTHTYTHSAPLNIYEPLAWLMDNLFRSRLAARLLSKIKGTKLRVPLPRVVRCLKVRGPVIGLGWCV